MIIFENNHSSTTLVLGFPGVGKSTYCSKHKACFDSDSSTIDKSNFKANYKAEILKRLKTNPQYLFVSTHPETFEIAKELIKEAYVNVAVVVPRVEDKEAYIKRYLNRGSPDSFIELMDKNFEKFVSDCEQGAEELKALISPLHPSILYRSLDALVNDGVYVEARIKAGEFLDRIRELQNVIIDKTDVKLPPFEPHITLMYSNSEYPLDAVKKLTDTFDTKVKARVIGFDTLPYYDSKCIVLKLDCSMFKEYHEQIKEMGIEPSFKDYHCHITLVYSDSADLIDVNMNVKGDVEFDVEYLVNIIES